MPEIVHELKVSASRDEVFAALSTHEGMQGWHTAHVEGDGKVGSTWKFDYPGHPSFAWKVTDSKPGDRVVWKCEEGPGNSVGTSVEYRLSETKDGRTLIQQSHNGWPDKDDNFNKCNTLWGVLLHHLQQYVETSAVKPAFG